MGMDAELVARNDACDLDDDALDFVGKRSAIGVAEHRPARAGFDRGLGAQKRVFRIGLVAVEEMLAIDHRLAAGGDRRLDAVGDGLEILFERAAERDVDVVVPATWRRRRSRRRRRREAPATPGSLAAERPGRLVMPKAQKRARLVGFCLKNLVSSGLAPG